LHKHSILALTLCSPVQVRYNIQSNFNDVHKWLFSGAAVHVLNKLTEVVNNTNRPAFGDDFLRSLFTAITYNDEISANNGQIIPLLKRPSSWMQVKRFFRKPVVPLENKWNARRCQNSGEETSSESD